jgi:hypothetical protein
MLQRFVDPAAVPAEISRVRLLSGYSLRQRWQAEFGRAAPELLTANLLRRMIANRIQEEAFGTLDRDTLKLLDGLVGRAGSRPTERNLKIGTVLVRDYQGRCQTVTASILASRMIRPNSLYCLRRIAATLAPQVPTGERPSLASRALISSAGIAARGPDHPAGGEDPILHSRSVARGPPYFRDLSK